MSNFTVTFQQGTPIWNLYQRLKKAGVKDEDLNMGYLKTDYVEKKRETVGKDDYKIQEEEVWKFVLERNKYGSWSTDIKETTGEEIVWTLENVEIKTKIKSAIAEFKRILGYKGYKEGADAYNELLGVSLYAFVMATNRRGILLAKVPEDAKKELKVADLGDIENYIEKNGGLALIEIQNDCEIEATALEALKNSCGWCTEETKILYAVFKMAELWVEPVYGLPKYEAMKNLPIKSQTHISIALVLSGKKRYFDPALKMADAEQFYKRYFNFWHNITNREFLAIHHGNLGVSYLSKKQFDLAEKEFTKAIQIDSDCFEAHNNLGVVYLMTGRRDSAKEEFVKAIQINPDCAEGHNNLGRINILQEEYDSAAIELKKAVQLYSDYVEAHYNLGILYRKKGQVNLAIEEFQDAVQIDKDFFAAHIHLAEIYDEAGQTEKVISEYKEIIRINPAGVNIVAIHNNLGVAYIDKMEIELAIKELQNAIQMDAHYSESYFNLGKAYAIKGDILKKEYKIKEAVEMYQKSMGMFHEAAAHGLIVPKEIIDHLQSRVEKLSEKVK